MANVGGELKDIPQNFTKKKARKDQKGKESEPQSPTEVLNKNYLELQNYWAGLVQENKELREKLNSMVNKYHFEVKESMIKDEVSLIW